MVIFHVFFGFAAREARRGRDLCILVHVDSQAVE